MKIIMTKVKVGETYPFITFEEFSGLDLHLREAFSDKEYQEVFNSFGFFADCDNSYISKNYEELLPPPFSFLTMLYFLERYSFDKDIVKRNLDVFIDLTTSEENELLKKFAKILHA